MMHFNELPDLVVRTVFRILCEEQIHSKSDSQCNLDKWSDRLALLSVSRAWRNMALPLIHKQAFISLITSDSNQELEPQIFVKTSLDTIPSNKQSVCQPSYLLICIEFNESFIPAIDALLKQARQKASLLGSVEHLDISIGVQNGDSWQSRSGLPEDIAQAVSLGNEFASLVPGITNYEWPFVVNDDILLAFIRTITGHYASSLRKISCELAALEDVERFSDSLQHLDIRCYSNDFNRFPLVQSANLTMVRLIGIEKEFTWCSFQGSKDPTMLDFSRLRHMCLGVPFVSEENAENNDPDAIWFGPADVFEYKIFAPQLTKLRIQLCPFALSALSSITGTNVLPELDILTLVGVVFKFTNLRLDDAVRRMFSRYANNSANNANDNEMVFMDWIVFGSDILAIPKLADHIRIEVGSFGSKFAESTLDWQYLDCLTVYETVDISYVVALIERLPYLKELKAMNIELGITDDSQLTIPGLYNSSENIVLQPLDVGIKRITLKSDFGVLPDTLQANVTNHLYKIFPKLDSAEF